MIDPFETLEAHHALGREPVPLATSAGAIGVTADAAPIFDLESMWHRGRFRPSLLAETPERSEAWRAQYALEGLPLLPPLVEGARIASDPWRWLARENGREERKLQERSGLRKDDFIRLRQIAEQQDVLFQLPFWQPPDERAIPDHLLYWSDSGALHWQLGLREQLLANWRSPPPDGPSDKQRRILKKPRETSWEGFAISSLLRAAGIRAKGNVWRAPDGEIDLILLWPEARSTWAIEITLGRKKPLSPGFDLGCKVTQAERGIIVFNDRIGKPKVTWPRRLSRVVEVMKLEDALREVKAGP